MARKHQHRSRVITAFVRIPGELEAGKVRCLGCSAVVGLTPNSHIPRHNSPAGEPCAFTATYAEPVHLDALPPVVVPAVGRPPNRSSIKDRAAAKRSTPEQIAANASLAPRTNKCVDRGRWLPGERTLCGRCAVAREKNRKKR